MNIKSLVLGSASLSALLVASSAFAADLPKHHSKAPMAIMVKSQPAIFAWDGPYAGAEIGGHFVSFSNKVDGKKISSAEAKKQFGEPQALVGGVFAGYNANVGNNLILGVDGNVDFGKVEKNINTASDVDGSIFKEKLSGAARVRVGYAMDRFMPYVAGGLSVVNLEAAAGGRTKSTISDGKLTTKAKLKSSSAMGWNIGAGVDYAISDNLILRADYRHNKISDPKVSYAKDNKHDAEAKDIELKSRKDFSINSNDVRVGIAYKF